MREAGISTRLQAIARATACALLLFGGAFALFDADGAHAEMVSKDLDKACADYPNKSADTALCEGYVGGTIDSFHALNRMPLRLFCEPEPLTTDQAVELTRKYFKEHPEYLPFAATAIMLKMMMATYPCPPQE